MAAFNQFGQPSNQDVSQMPSQYGNRAPRQQYSSNSDPFASAPTGGGGYNGTQNPYQSTVTPPAAPQAFQNNSYAPSGAPQQQQPQQSGFDYSNYNPGLAQVFQNAGITPTGAGTGNTDIAYWQGKINSDPSNAQYYINRVQGDLAGNGMDSNGGGNPTSGLFPNVSYTPGQLPTTDFATYQPGTLSQYSAINQQPTVDLQNQVLQQVLSNPSLSPDVINQMQGQLHNQAATMLQGQMGNIRQGYAGLGYNGGGMEGADIQNAQLGSAANLLNQYNQLNTTAAEQNYQDRLNASNAATSAMTGQVNNATNQYNTGLQGQMAQQQLNQLGVQSQNAATQFALQRALENEGMKQAAAGIGVQTRGQDIQSLLGLSNLGFGYAQLQNQMNQQALQNALQYGVQ